MDTSASISRPIDFITEKVSVPTHMTRDDYADLFEAVQKLLAPSLSSIGLKPLEQIADRVFPTKTAEHLDSKFRGSRLALIYQTPHIKNARSGNEFIHEVYLTEQNYWIILKTWRTGPDAVKVVFTRAQFLSYYDEMRVDNLLHPSHWLVEAPRLLVGRTINKAEARLSDLRELENKLDAWERRYQLISASNI